MKRIDQVGPKNKKLIQDLIENERTKVPASRNNKLRFPHLFVSKPSFIRTPEARSLKLNRVEPEILGMPSTCHSSQVYEQYYTNKIYFRHCGSNSYSSCDHLARDNILTRKMPLLPNLPKRGLNSNDGCKKGNSEKFKIEDKYFTEVKDVLSQKS